MRSAFLDFIATAALAAATGCKASPNHLTITDDSAESLDAIEVTANGSIVETRMYGQRRWTARVPHAEHLELSVVGKKGDVRSPLGKCELRAEVSDTIFVTVTKDGRIVCDTMGS